MSGVSAPLPLDLHAWDPITLSGPSASVTLPLTVSAAAGTPARHGTAAATVLPLAAGVGTGVVYVNVIGSGTGIVIPESLGIGIGRKSTTQQGGSLAFRLSCSPAFGHGPGLGDLISVNLGIGRGNGRHFELRFTPPSQMDYRPIQAAYPSLLNIAIPYGQTVWRDPQGVWHSANYPNPSRLVGADRLYAGGHDYALSNELLDELRAAGFGDCIKLQEIYG